MTSPEDWIARADEVLRAGGLNERENDFVREVRHRKAWSVAKPRRRKYLLTPAEERVAQQRTE
jgi:hypothetical protein